MSLRSYLGGTLFVEQREGVRPPLLGLHGWGRDRRDLAGIVGHREALLPDLPGFGASPPPPEAWGAAEYGKALAELLRAHGHGPYVVVAHSFGGRAAVELAAAHPELVAGMVLCGVPLVRLTAPSRPKRSLRFARWAARHGLASESPLFVEWMQANYAFHDVIYGVAAMPFVERLAKSARRTFIGDRVWSARVELDEMYAKNDLQHRAIRDAIAAGSAAGARLLAREHVLSSGRLLEIVIESLGSGDRDPGW